MSSHSHDEERKGYSPHIHGAALGILVMGISLAVIIILWIAFGYRGSAFSTQIMRQQQDSLRKQYGLPPQPNLSPEQLEVPPSLRNITAANNATTGAANATNATTGAANATNATTGAANATNATTGAANATNATTGAATGNATTGTSTTSTGGGGTSVSISPGASSLTNTAFNPNPVKV